jgi:3-deoxy-D-manno-octulosonate 8-phosphate phosphatase (KDO 8-P phosphatase)
MTYVYQGHIEKIPILEEILQKAQVDRGEVAYIGDDLTDVTIMRRVGFAVAPANARPEVKAAAHYVTGAPGGDGAVREAIELILKAQGALGEDSKALRDGQESARHRRNSRSSHVFCG